MRKRATTGARPRGGWRQWTEAEARAALDDWSRSGLSAAAFTRERGVSARRLAYWTRRLGQDQRVQFVPVELAAAAAQPRAQIEIERDGVVVRVREDLPVEHVARLAAALRTTC